MNPVLLTTFWEVVGWIIITFFWVCVIWMFIATFSDIFRRRDLSGWGKAGWVILIFVLPFIGILAYLITRPPVAAYEETMDFAGAPRGTATSPADEIAKAQQLLNSGAITQEEFNKIKESTLA